MHEPRLRPSPPVFSHQAAGGAHPRNDHVAPECLLVATLAPMSQRSIEVKVGALISRGAGPPAGFIVVMGDSPSNRRSRFSSNFENPGSLQAGAPVRMAGMQIGKVSEVQFRGGEIDPTTQEPAPPIRVVAKLEQRTRRPSARIRAGT